MTDYLLTLRLPALAQKYGDKYDLQIPYRNTNWFEIRKWAKAHRQNGYTVRVRRLPKDWVDPPPWKPSEETRAKIREMWEAAQPH